jgi:hypothetical protein
MENNPKNAEKLHILAKELMPFLIDILPDYPHFLDGLKKKPTQNPTKPTAKNGSIYLPELDYLVYYANFYGQFRTCGFAPAGSKHAYLMPPLPKNPDVLNLPIGLYAVGGNYDERRHCVIPTPTLKRSVTLEYGMPYALDYRLTTDSRTMYMKGIVDMSKAGAAATKNLSVRVIDWSNVHPDPKHLQKIISNTHKFWDTMPDDGGKSIVTKTTMMELLDGFESGLFMPGEVQWQIDSIKSWVGDPQPVNKLLHAVDKTDAATPHKISIARMVTRKTIA